MTVSELKSNGSLFQFCIGGRLYLATESTGALQKVPFYFVRPSGSEAFLTSFRTASLRRPLGLHLGMVRHGGLHIKKKSLQKALDKNFF
jgi:hypothetical protein